MQGASTVEVCACVILLWIDLIFFFQIPDSPVTWTSSTFLFLSYMNMYTDNVVPTGVGRPALHPAHRGRRGHHHRDQDPARHPGQEGRKFCYFLLCPSPLILILCTRLPRLDATFSCAMHYNCYNFTGKLLYESVCPSPFHRVTEPTNHSPSYWVNPSLRAADPIFFTLHSRLCLMIVASLF